MSAVGKPKSDLGVRAVSGVVMIGILVAALWVGGWPFTVMVVTIGAIGIYELLRLTAKLTTPLWIKIAVGLMGIIYLATACYALVVFRRFAIAPALLPIAATIATDIGAYFAGRAIGGPKIAPLISPSKTWSGLGGGMLASSLACVFIAEIAGGMSPFLFGLLGLIFAIVAQVGDFAESYLKRRAGVKDSGTLIPGHGGLLDRIDGLAAVLASYFVIQLVIVSVVGEIP